ncbi:hypothetical protein [Streptomyces sp. NPDC051214]|uniref:hypothetical protein n=1 Tax=Streptomyces sp. NPDC051214 TaxID=3155282 RepID=UPI00341E054B
MAAFLRLAGDVRGDDLAAGGAECCPSGGAVESGVSFELLLTGFTLRACGLGCGFVSGLAPCFDGAEQVRPAVLVL